MIAFILNEFEKIVCAAIFLAMTLLGFANVVVRYGTNLSLAATEELLTNGFLVLTVFGAAIAARRGEHLAVTVVQDALPRRAAQAVYAISTILAVVLLGASAWFSWESLRNMMANEMSSYALGLPAWYYQAALPFGFGLIIVRYLQHAAETLASPRSEPPATPDV